MPFPIAPLAVAGISALISAIPKIVQSIKARKMKKEADTLESQYQRPDYEIAPSVEKMVGFAEQQTHAGDLPGGQMYRNQLGEATAAGITAMKEMGRGSEAYGGISNLVQGEQEQLRGLQQDYTGMIQQNEDRYLDTLGIKAGEERPRWEWEEADPYMMAASKAAQLRKSGTEGRMDAFSDMAGVGAEFIGGLDDVDWGGIFQNNKTGVNDTGGASLANF